MPNKSPELRGYWRATQASHVRSPHPVVTFACDWKPTLPKVRSSNGDSLDVLSCDGFLNYILSDDNIIISRDKLDLCHDMDKPLSHYFINSSHNTYLIGHQLTGRSSVEIYRQCLLAGCRCVELDFWNGRIDEPIVVHGYTLVPEISAKEVLEAIAESAFKTSDWPVILSFENHCNPRQQAKIAQYCREFFGDMLLDTAMDNYPLTAGTSLPPPCSLKRKILIKNKKKHRTHKKKEGGMLGPGGGNVGVGLGVAIGVGVGVGETQFHVELNPSEVAEANSTGGTPGRSVPGNGDLTRPPLHKTASHDSSEGEHDDPNGEGDAIESSSSDEDEESTLSPEDRRHQSKDTSSEEVEAGAEISELVNYIQPVHFHSFEVSEKRNRSYEMSSFVETHALNLLKENPVEFVNYNKRQLARVYPRGTRVDSSNFLPHQFWNAGCQLVALNYQTLDLSMQLNIGLFEFNNRSGFLLKPDFMIRPDRRFDPFAESTVDGIIAGTVSVQVISGQFLSEKRVGCYVEVEMYGLPADTVRKRFKTKTVPNNAINPVWDEDPFVFKKVVLPELATLRIAAYEDSGSKPLLGHRVLSLVGLRPGYRHIVLRNEAGQPLGLSSLFVYIKVRDYVPDGLSDFAEALVNPIKYQSELEKRAQQLSVFQDDDDCTDGEDDANFLPNTPIAISFREGVGVCGTSGSGEAGGGGERGAGVDTGGSNGDVLTSAAGHSSEVSGPRRQNSVSHKYQLAAKVSEEKSALDFPASSLETVVIEAEDVEKLSTHKTFREKKLKADKELYEIRKKHKKERQGLASGVDKKKKELVKQHSKLEKKMSSTKSIDESSPPARLSSEHQHRLTEVTQGYQTALHAMLRQQLDHERRMQDKHHEALYVALEKLLKLSQAAQLKNLQNLHDRGVEDLKKRQDEFLRDHRKSLTKTTSDKQELERKKREMRQGLVVKGIQERQRLTDLYEKKKEELEKKQEDVRKKFEEEREKARLMILEEYEKKMSDVENYSMSEDVVKYQIFPWCSTAKVNMCVNSYETPTGVRENLPSQMLRQKHTANV
ncbi:Phospholipase C phosphatidylinositol-specific Y domain [Trinorchestia longiramus]|nr:Phospholipase C phosphatidylinositol-specific Y domain [Trinorchestia longiramus]